MEVFIEETVTNLMNENKSKNVTENEQSLNTRCLRKKYKCVMLWLLSIIVLTQFMVILLDKLDEKYINNFVEKVSKFLIKSTPHLSNNSLVLQSQIGHL